jgi:hypothetical protein
MSDLGKNVSEGSLNDIDSIPSGLQRLQEDLYLSKCEIKTAIREVDLKQRYVHDILNKIQYSLTEISDRLHGIELKQERQNSQT